MRIKPVLNQFNGGEISPILEGRFDLPKYSSSQKIMKDFVPLSEGGAKRRGGSHYVSAVKESDAVLFKINATPSNASVYINGQEISEVFCAVGDEVTYSVSLSRYQTRSGKMLIVEDTILNIELLSLYEKCIFTINPTPVDADVFIMEEKTSSLQVLKGSTASYRVVKLGYDESSGSLQVTDDTVLSVVLTISFSINVVQSGATVTINGKNVSSVIVNMGDIITWSVSKAGYEEQRGSEIISGSTTKVVDLRLSYNINEVVVEKSVPGTYEVDVKISGYYHLRICGAGGGAEIDKRAVGSALDYNGGSAAAFAGKVYLLARRYNFVVGTGGRGGLRGSGYDGGDSYINADSVKLITCGGGKKGSTSANAGILTMGSLSVQSFTIKQNGVARSIVSILDNGCGAGGNKNKSAEYAGQNGYVRLTYAGQV